MKICKEAAVLTAGTPDEAQLAKINIYAKSPLRAADVYCFYVHLCDDAPDRDYERFDTAALPELARLFLGKTGICDHEWSADRQIARIFDTELCTEQGVTSIRAGAYMLRSEKNADLIAEIEGGIKKEVSVGCAMKQARCSICGEDYGQCAHRKGVTYDGTCCLAVLSQPVDAYEFSFVAVPAQREAGVLKAKKGGAGMTLEELVSESGTPAEQARFKSLCAEAEFGRDCRKTLEQEVVSLGLLLEFGASEEILRKAAAALTGTELRAWKHAMEQKSAALFPPQTQLPAGGSGTDTLEAAYLI